MPQMDDAILCMASHGTPCASRPAALPITTHPGIVPTWHGVGCGIGCHPTTLGPNVTLAITLVPVWLRPSGLAPSGARGWRAWANGCKGPVEEYPQRVVEARHEFATFPMAYL